MSDFVDQHRDTCGVEPIYKVLQIFPSGYRRYVAVQRDPDKRCDRGSQCVSIRYSERLAETGVEPSVGWKGDSYDTPWP